MNPTTVLITGAGGQLGLDVVDAFAAADPDFHIVAAARADLDVGDRTQVLDLIGDIVPDLIVNCAAWTAVDLCESDTDRAYRDNTMAVRHLAEGAWSVGAHLTTISTDYVFDGTKDSPYVEWDATNPQSVYGRSKLGGEHEAGPEATVIRTSWVNGARGNNMAKTILRLLSEHDTLKFVDDQIGHPTMTADLAVMVQQLSEQRRPGVYHVTNQGAVSWCEFARAVARAIGTDPDRVQPINTVDLDPPRPAPRPANSVLDNAALRLAGIEPLRHFEPALAELIESL